MVKVKCIEQFSTLSMTFRTGEEYTGSTVNENWWVVDSIGISAEDFTMHFEIQEEVVNDQEEPLTEVTSKRFVEEEKMFMEIMRSFGYDGITDEQANDCSNHKWLEKVKGYIFA